MIEGPAGGSLVCQLPWLLGGCHDSLPANEAVVQALSGLMAVHGRDRERPRRLGLEVASVAAGVLGAQAVLSALIARARGQDVTVARTTVLQGALMFLVHHLAMATCGTRLEPPGAGGEPGPPLRTLDGHWVEIEALDPEHWAAFWSQLGVSRSQQGQSWLAVAYRPNLATCRLPTALHQAAAGRTLEELRHAARSSGVALCRIRRYGEIIAERLQASADVPPWRMRSLTEQGQAPSSDGAPGGAPSMSSRSAGTKAASPPSAGPAPLSGIRVVESTSRVQGPLAGLLLSLLGAEVTRVEPVGGDVARMVPPVAGGLGAVFVAFNRGKQAVELDPKNAAGRAGLLDLAREADVFLHNWRPGRAEALGITDQDLGSVNPALVYARASGWDPSSRHVPEVATEYLVQAHTGCADALTPLGEPPAPSPLTLADVMGGLLACEAVLAGLYRRSRTGLGCSVVTTLEGAARSLHRHLAAAAPSGLSPRCRNGRPCWGLLDQPLQTAAGFLTVDAEAPEARSRLMAASGLGQSADGTAQDDALAALLRDDTAEGWERRLIREGCIAAAVREDLSSLPADPRLGGLLEPVDEGACWVPVAPWQFAS